MALAWALPPAGQKAIHEGNGTVCILVDEKANPAQRAALLSIASGEAGGLPFEIISATFSKVLDPRFVSFQFEVEGRNGRVQMGDVVTASFAPIKNPVTGEPESVRVQHGTGFILKKPNVFPPRKCGSTPEN